MALCPWLYFAQQQLAQLGPEHNCKRHFRMIVLCIDKVKPKAFPAWDLSVGRVS